MTLAAEPTHADMVARGDELRKRGDLRAALEAYGEAASSAGEEPGGDLCIKAARAAAELGDVEEAIGWLRLVAESVDSFRHWLAAANVLGGLPAEDVAAWAARTGRIAITTSYNASQLVPMIRLAGLWARIAVETFEGDYDQYQQDLMNPSSALYAFEPQFVVLAVHEGAVRLPSLAEAASDTVEEEAARWRTLWQLVRERSQARVVQHLFATRPETPFGHLAARLPETRHVMLQSLNAELGKAAGDDVLVVDCDRLAGAFGKWRWFDDRYWHLSKQAVALDALPLLARHTVAVVAADLGLTRKCLVVDLDNTLWGGVIGEDGLAGIRLGNGAEGEAYVAFQEAILELKNRGILVAVCTKNNPEDARAVFEQHPDMRLRLDDVACFVANWESKPENLQAIAQTLNIGLDSLVYADDNPAERELVRRFLPDVDVLRLPPDPALYARTLADYPFFEASSFTADDTERTSRYRARAETKALAETARDLDSFLRELRMQATIAPVDDLHLPRVTQLIGKTNQFNLTSRRHSADVVRAWTADPDGAHFYAKLRDRFADHGLVGVALARRRDGALEIDTFLMSCRVIGRTLERAMLRRLCEAALALGCTKLRGTYVPTSKNAVVESFYRDSGFNLVRDEGESGSVWEYNLEAAGPIASDFIAEDREE